MLHLVGKITAQDIRNLDRRFDLYMVCLVRARLQHLYICMMSGRKGRTSQEILMEQSEKDPRQ